MPQEQLDNVLCRVQGMMALVLVGSLPARFRIGSTFHSVGEAGEVAAGSAVAGEAARCCRLRRCTCT